MKFKKGNILESLDMESKGEKTFSEAPQNIIITESQLDHLLENLVKDKK